MPVRIPDAGELRDKVRVLEIVPIGTCRRGSGEEEARPAGWRWREKRKAWAKVTSTERTAVFSNTGVGAREVELILRRQRLELGNAIEWKKQFCLLTAVTPLGPGHLLVRGALAEPVVCRTEEPEPMSFPAVRAEKDIRHTQESPMSVNRRELVLVVPKEVTLTPGYLVYVGGGSGASEKPRPTEEASGAQEEPWEVLVPHELDPYKNEYEIGRRVEL